VRLKCSFLINRSEETVFHATQPKQHLNYTFTFSSASVLPRILRSPQLSALSSTTEKIADTTPNNFKMSPILARAAVRAAVRNAPVRNISMMRSFARSFEAHPFERLVTASKPAPANYSKMAKNAATRFAL
jgi:hypothetical protein